MSSWLEDDNVFLWVHWRQFISVHYSSTEQTAEMFVHKLQLDPLNGSSISINVLWGTCHVQFKTAQLCLEINQVWRKRNPPTSHSCSVCSLRITCEGKKTRAYRHRSELTLKLQKLIPHPVCCASSCWQFKLDCQLSSAITQHRWRPSYLFSPSLWILYFSRNSACFCRRISVCLLKPLTLQRSTERFSSSTHITKLIK